VSEVQETEVQPELLEADESSGKNENVYETEPASQTIEAVNDAQEVTVEEPEESALAETQQTLEEVEDFWASNDGEDATLTRKTTTTTRTETVYEEVIATSEEVVNGAASQEGFPATSEEEVISATSQEEFPATSEDVVASNQAYESASSELDDQYSVTSPPSEATVVEVEAEDQQVMEPVDDFWGSS